MERILVKHQYTYVEKLHTQILTGRVSSQVRYFVVVEQRKDNAQRGYRQCCPKRQQDTRKVHVHTTNTIEGCNGFHAGVESSSALRINRFSGCEAQQLSLFGIQISTRDVTASKSKPIGSQYPEHSSSLYCIY